MPIWSMNATKYQIEMWYQYYTVFEKGNNIDLLTESEDYARKHVGRVKNQEFKVLREGWTR